MGARCGWSPTVGCSKVYFNGTKLYEVDDATFSKRGKVGVWTKADSITLFDDLTVVTK